MKSYIPILSTCPLFKGLSAEHILQLLLMPGCHKHRYAKESFIAEDGQKCSALAIVLSGIIEIQKVYSTGKILTLSRLTAGQIFGEAIVFSHQQTYPATVLAITKAEVLFIDSQQIVKLCTLQPLLLENFMRLLSDKLLLLNKKVRDLSFDTIREKLCNYLLDEYQLQQSQTIKLPISKKILAEHMGVQRPSLSRELMKLRRDGLIDFSKNTITIQNLTALENIVTS